ncbi:MAG TPA: LysR family transcriptional regulator [Polyangiaceae bacterium]|nr:LysR family transcriptional regulator [Polyangiaceae bacterium]
MPELADMSLFVRAALSGSLSAAGRALGFSPAVASKRLARLEAELGTRLIQRTSRRLKLTEEGATYLEFCRSILAQVDAAEVAVGRGRHQPSGTLRVSSPVALGRRWVGPTLGRFAAEYPHLSVQLALSDAMIDLLEQGFDCAVRIGHVEDSRLIARRLADNRRVVCGSPEYLARRGSPRIPADLYEHDCIVMSSGSVTHADWTFFDAHGPAKPTGSSATTVRVHGRWVSNSGEQAHDWALAGLGLERRSIWDVAQELADGRLIEVLSDWTSEPAPIHVVFPSKSLLPARTRLFVDRLVTEFAQAQRAISAAGARATKD